MPNFFKQRERRGEEEKRKEEEMMKEIQEELKNNEVLRGIEKDYEDEVGSLSSDGEVADEMEIDNQPVEVTDSVRQIE